MTRLWGTDSRGKLIWVFARFDRNRAAVTDEAFFNRRNLFVLDVDAREQSTERAVLTFNGYLQRPQVIADQVHDVWEAARSACCSR